MLQKLLNLAGLNESLTGPNAIAFSNEDVVAPAKILNDFAKKHEALEIKAGVIEGNVATVEEIKALAELPSREGLLSMFLACFKHLFAILLLLQKLLQIKKKNKARKLIVAYIIKIILNKLRRKLIND